MKMYYLTDMCFLCLKNNIKLQSVLKQDTDAIIVNEKLKCIFPEITLEPNIPVCICFTCRRELHSFYAFKQRCMENYCRWKHFTKLLQGSGNGNEQSFGTLHIEINNIEQENQMEVNLKSESLERQYDLINYVAEEDNIDIKEDIIEYENSEVRNLCQQLLSDIKEESDIEEDLVLLNHDSISDSISGALITVLVCLIILILVVAILLAKNVYNGKELREEYIETGLINFKFDEEHKLNPFLKVKDQAELLPYDIKWEIPRNKIKLGRNLGSGCFGFVVDATILNFFDGEPRKIVAVKMMHRNSNIKDFNLFINELKLMARFEKHDNLLNLLGACTENIAERKLLVVVEYCKHGSLRNYLLENHGSFVKLIDPNTKLIYLAGVQDAKAINGGLEMKRITTVELVRWALQVARGMEFLASRKVLHGDLALRNVLLAENYVAKISDFGLSRNLTSSDYYRMTSQSLLPIKWMAPESIRDKTFSTWSDVWSFGVVLWELFSLAQTPYAELLPDFRSYQKLESGYRLEQPKHTTNDMYHMMRECWHVRPTSRPTFPHLDIDQPFREYDYDTESSANVINKKVYDKLINRPPLQESKTSIHSYQSTKRLPIPWTIYTIRAETSILTKPNPTSDDWNKN